MNWFKRQAEKIIPHQHDFTLSYIVGDFHKYYCKDKDCVENKYTLVTSPTCEIVDGKYVWTEKTTTVLTEEEAQPYITKSNKSIKATMWLLDNVEPTYSAGRDDGTDYKYKTVDSIIIKK